MLEALTLKVWHGAWCLYNSHLCSSGELTFEDVVIRFHLSGMSLVM